MFTAFCGLACVLLIGLWVRSYSWADSFGGYTQSANQNTGTFRIEFVSGRMIFTAVPGLRVALTATVWERNTTGYTLQIQSRNMGFSGSTIAVGCGVCHFGL